MKKVLIFLITMIITNHVFSQTEKFDIATFVPPQNWQRLDSNGVIAFHDYKTNNNLTSFCQIVLFPSRTGSGNASKDFKQEWSERVTKTTGSKAKATTQTEKTPDGWTVVTGSAKIALTTMTYACMLVTISGFGKVMSVMVNTAGGDYTATIGKFFNDLDLDSKATVAVASQNKNNYDFITPEGWQLQNNKDHIQIQNIQSGCLIRILEPQPSSGNMEQDAIAVFDMMYKGWQYQKTGTQRFIMSKGFLPKGLEYCMIEAGMSKLSADGTRYDGFEEGAALVVKAGTQIVIISVRHNTSFIGHDDCRLKYETWRRFFNSFTVKNIAIPNSTEDISKRIIGKWTASEAGAIGDYIFAANGNYGFIGAIGTSSTSSDYRYEYLHIRTYAFEGDGSYSIAGNQLTLKKRGVNPKQVKFRFEKVNRGGAGWNERIYLLSKSSSGENEVCYEKAEK
jgi:hypothetical protein